MDIIEQILWDKTVDELSRLCSIANVKGSSGTKSVKVKKLCEFYSNENWVKEVFESLPKFEREMMECIIKYKYHPEQYELEKIKKKYKKPTWGEWVDRKSKLNLFFMNRGAIPSRFREKLNELVEPLKIEIKPTKEKIDPEDFYANIIGRDSRGQDFDEFIKYINVNKIKATKAKGQMPKSALVKIHNILKYHDVLRNEDIEFEYIRKIEDTIVSNTIMNFLTNSLIVEVKKGEFVINELFCKDYLKLNKVEKIKYLLKCYTREDSFFFNECERIQSNNYHIENRVPEFGKARKMILEYLKMCPINEWIDVDDIKKYIRLNEYCFLRKFTGDVLIKDQYYNDYYNTASHDEFENYFIDIVLMEYIATLGIIDVVIDRNYDDYGYKSFLVPKYFRITKLGSYALEMEKEEAEDEGDEEELVVTEDFKIIIGETNQKLKHELYFDRFLKKISENPLTYKLDFFGMAKALELGIKFKEIFEYIEINSENSIPKNVKKQFEIWTKDSKRIKIKTITVLEVDNDNFYDIVNNKKFDDYIDSVRKDVIVLKNSKIDSVKKELNRNGMFYI